MRRTQGGAGSVTSNRKMQFFASAQACLQHLGSVLGARSLPAQSPPGAVSQTGW
jgi:hypothetical protein